MAQIEPETESLEVWTLLCRLFETEGWPALDFAPNSDTRVQARLKSRSNLECLLRYYTFPRCEMDPILEAMQLQHKIIKTDPANLLPARRLMCEKHFDLAWRVFIRTENVTPKKDIRSPGISVAQKSLTPTYSRSSLDRWKNVRNEFLNRPDWNDPLIQGRDLLKSGVQPGPKMGHILDQIRDQQLLDKIHSPAEALELASSLIASEKNNSSERQD